MIDSFPLLIFDCLVVFSNVHVDGGFLKVCCFTEK